MYPVWFPFDWMENDFIYVALILYQLLGIGVMVEVNFVCDSLPTVFIAMLTVHLELLCQRVAMIGWNTQNKSPEVGLSECIRDHKIIIQNTSTCWKNYRHTTFGLWAYYMLHNYIVGFLWRKCNSTNLLWALSDCNVGSSFHRVLSRNIVHRSN